MLLKAAKLKCKAWGRVSEERFVAMVSQVTAV
jgi:hypothetical protein